MKIAVASCSKFADVPVQAAWNEILEEQPDALILAGDFVYLLPTDNKISDARLLSDKLTKLYQDQFAESNFAALRNDLKARGKPVYAIYDDHDFIGDNRCGAAEKDALRVAARKVFVKTFSPPMTKTDVYSFTPGDLVDVIVLDGRYYRKNAGKAEAANRDAMLGADQWTWLEDVLDNQAKAKYTLIVSGTTFHHLGDAASERWRKYLTAYNRLLTRVAGHPGRLIVSGDIHVNAMCGRLNVVEVVTSGVARIGKNNTTTPTGGMRKNYAILEFDEDMLRVDLRSLQRSGKLQAAIPLSDWKLPSLVTHAEPVNPGLLGLPVPPVPVPPVLAPPVPAPAELVAAAPAPPAQKVAKKAVPKKAVPKKAAAKKVAPKKVAKKAAGKKTAAKKG